MGIEIRIGLGWAVGKIITKVMMGKLLDGYGHRHGHKHGF